MEKALLEQRTTAAANPAKRVKQIKSFRVGSKRLNELIINQMDFLADGRYFSFERIFPPFSFYKYTRTISNSSDCQGGKIE